MSENLKGRLSSEDRINAEFKHLRKRIKKLEELVLANVVDGGEIRSTIKTDKKG